MVINSPVFSDGEPIPPRYTCDGDNVNPPLAWYEVPLSAMGLALIVDDPDAPSGLFTHWVLWNIDTANEGIAENSIPAGAVEGTNGFGAIGYGGPCPPDGTHRYRFRLFALDTLLELPIATTSDELERAMEGHIVGQAVHIGTYRRAAAS